MNETLEQDTFEEIDNYKITYENNNIFNEDKLNNNFSGENELILENSDSNDLNQESQDETNSDDTPVSEECTALVALKENRLLTAQTMFKKSIKVSIKSFLISLSLSFLNLFI